MDFDAVASRLELAINAIVVRHRTAGDILTWRLMHAIEEEAFQELKATRGLNEIAMRMVHSSHLMKYPKNDEPVNFGQSNALPMAFYIVRRAYNQTH
jgi:hypothetical protein